MERERAFPVVQWLGVEPEVERSEVLIGISRLNAEVERERESETDRERQRDIHIEEEL